MDGSKTASLDTLKHALLLERQGKAFYSKTAAETSIPGLKDIFITLADEEQKHIEYLNSLFAEYGKSGGFTGAPLPEGPGELTGKVLTPEIKQAINAAEYEAAAISASIEMEKKAVRLYSGRAETAEDPEEKEFYRSLAAWENGHLDLLVELDKEILESIWNENSFWPF